MIGNILPYFKSDIFLLPNLPALPDTQNYIGLSAFFLMLFGMIIAVRERKSKAFMLLLGVLIFAKIYGRPLWYNNFFGGLPGFDLVLFIKYAQSLVSLSVAALVAFGLEALIRQKIRRTDFIVAAFLYACVLIWGLQHVPDHQFSDINVITLVLMSGLLWGMAFMLVFPKLLNYRLAVGVGLGAILFIELFSLVPRQGRPPRYESFTEPPFVSFLQEQQKPYRIFALDRLLYPEISSAFDIDDIRDLDALYVDRYVEYIRAFVSPKMYDRFTGVQEGPVSETEPVKLVGNQFFDLLNTKYVATKNPPIDFFAENEIVNAILEKNKPTPGLREYGFNVNKEFKRTLLVHAPQKVCAPIDIPDDKPFLLFSIAIDQKAWTGKGASDGADFSLVVNEETQFVTGLRPRDNAADRQWKNYAIDLSKFKEGGEKNLCLVTAEGKMNRNDLTGWADLRFAADANGAAPNAFEQYKSVYTGSDAIVYENTNALPRGFLVGSVIEKPEEEVIAAMKTEGFNVRQQAVVTAEKGRDAIPELSALDGEKCQTGAGIRDYKRPNPNRLSFTIDSPGNCFLVWSDTDYPGWIAKVDGKKQTIHQADLMFRGLVLTPGTHEVRFVYRPVTFYGGLVGTFVGLLYAGYIAMQYRQGAEIVEKPVRQSRKKQPKKKAKK
jgi:hypothetical protein